jgi:hypothetical protein
VTALAAVSYAALPLLDLAARAAAPVILPTAPAGVFDPIVPVGMLAVFLMLATHVARRIDDGWVGRTALSSGIAAGLGWALIEFVLDVTTLYLSWTTLPPGRDARPPSGMQWSLVECYGSCFRPSEYVINGLWAGLVAVPLALSIGWLARRLPGGVHRLA